jgi:hypothetical protein
MVPDHPEDEAVDPPFVTPDELGESSAASPPRLLDEKVVRAFIHRVLTCLDSHYTKSFESRRGSLTTPSSYCYDFVLHKKG